MAGDEFAERSARLREQIADLEAAMDRLEGAVFRAVLASYGIEGGESDGASPDV